MKAVIIGTKIADQGTLKKAMDALRLETVFVATLMDLKKEVRENRWDIFCLDDDFFGSRLAKIEPLLKLIKQTGKPVVVFSSNRDFSHILKMKKLGVADYVIIPFNERELIMKVNAVLQKKTRLACIGGGTGLFNLLIGLKTLPQVLLTSIVDMSDDGGSSGKLSQSLGLLPPGDIRRSLVALSNAPEIMNQIMQYRFDKKGELSGHSFGNIFLAALTGVKGSMSEAVRSLSDILYLQGIVLPVSNTATTLVARFTGGTVIRGESKIDGCYGRSAELKLEELRHEPGARADSAVVASILFADFVTIGPGDLFTSVVTNLIVKSIREALVKSPAKKIYICNLMTKPGETTGFDAADHIKEIIKYLGEDCLDYVLVSNTKVSKQSLADYLKMNQEPVKLNSPQSIAKITEAKVILADIGNADELVRHDSINLKNEIQKIIYGQPNV